MMVVPARITRAWYGPVIEILQSRTLPFVEQDVHQAWDRLFDGQRGICPAELGADHPGAITTSGWEAEEGRAAKLRINIFSAALLPR